MTRFFRTAVFLGMICMLGGGKAAAEDVRVGRFGIIYGQKGGNAMLDYVSEDQLNDEGKEAVDELYIRENFSGEEKREIELAVRYWAERMGANTPVEQVSIYVGLGGDGSGGSAFSLSPFHFLIEDLTKGISPNGTVYDKFLAGRKSPYPLGLADNIIINEIEYPSSPTRLLLDDFSIMSTMMHELGHALGMVGGHTVDGSGTEAVFDPESFSTWNGHLHDVFGKKAERDMVIKMNVMDRGTANDPAVFQIFSQDGNNMDYLYPTFRGRNVDALTGGNGMPVMGGFSGGGNVMDGGNSLGHPGLMQSIMSYGIIRNMPFTEMELAVFQDIGYSIDRSQFFGKSYYYNVGGTSQVNRASFGTARNPNTAIFGLGTHIMRDNLTLVQAADIYAGGYGGGGVRIDGVGNSLTIPRNVVIAANGDMGTGLLVSYGSGNSIFLDGRAEALGTGGIGAHFGILAAGNDRGLMIGSYMPSPEAVFGGVDFEDFPIQSQYEYLKAWKDLDGALVQDVTISGRLSGRLAAIRIEEDAHVANIRVRSGAVISGDIVSHWARDTWDWYHSDEFSTTITFGETGASGNMYLDGDIMWKMPSGLSDGVVNSLDIVQSGGHLNYNSRSNGANVYSWQIHEGAVLSGNSSITIDGAQPLYNAGTISPGNNTGAITIDGGYEQTAQGTLLMEFTPGETDRFVVTGTSVIDSGATLVLQALPAFYATGSEREITDAELFANSSLSMGSFDEIELSDMVSATLDFEWTSSPAGNPVFSITRAANAYSQHGSNGTGISIGKALDGISAQVTGDMQNLFAAIDFSSADGSLVRSAFRQLAPAVYDNTAKASLHMNHVLSGLLLERIMAARMTSSTPVFTGGEISPVLQNPGGTVFVLPLAGYFGQSGWADNEGFNAIYGGAMGGVNRHFEEGLYGLHAAVFHRDTSSRSDGKARSRANGIRFGVHGAVLPQEGFFAGGLLSAGLENADVSRNVDINGYRRTNSSSFTAFTAQAAMRTGYEWAEGDFRLGPLAGLDYAWYHRPSVREKNGHASSLNLDSANFHSLRTALGGQVRQYRQLSGGQTLHIGLSLQWMHELLNTGYGSRGWFADYSSNGFSVENRTNDRNALAIGASVSLLSAKTANISGYVGTEFFRNGSSSVQAGFSASWRF